MSEFKWTATLDVGDDLMNREHQVLIEKMGKLASYNLRSLSKKDILFYYDDLIEYTKRHFRDEEALLEKLDYIGLDQHKRIHEGLLEAMNRYREEFNTSVSGRLPSSVLDFFRTWITTHILVVDKQYAGHLEKKTEADPF